MLLYAEEGSYVLNFSEEGSSTTEKKDPGPLRGRFLHYARNGP
jgi:hypothetical protein